jgi:hypothetical protein
MKVARLFVSHVWSDDLHSEFSHLVQCGRADNWLVLDSRLTTANQLRRWHSLTHAFSPEALATLYGAGSTRGLRGLVDHGHLVILDFFLKFPFYDYYWFIEYDVRYTGNWSYFFGRYDARPDDLITSHIRCFIEEPLWGWWQSFGHATLRLPTRTWLRSFNVIYRISNRALEFMDRMLRRGWHGHHEVLFPTLLHQNGFKLRDFGGTSKFTDPNEINVAYTSAGSRSGFLSVLGTIRWRPARSSPGKKEMMLYHPVKPESLMEPMEQKQAAYRRWQLELQQEISVATQIYKNDHFAARDFLCW